jgi:hypothetical protein
MTADGPAKVIVGHPLEEAVTVIPDRRGENDFVRTVRLGLSEIERIPRDDQRPGANRGFGGGRSGDR